MNAPKQVRFKNDLPLGQGVTIKKDTTAEVEDAAGIDSSFLTKFQPPVIKDKGDELKSTILPSNVVKENTTDI
ncbi:MAG: hypothetical protein QNJ31_03700 [Candidatus Caenarcaniphilales bacterium]|nr:hypothetical protein [Candidatus Caenarcaniphilales bacterium]